MNRAASVFAMITAALEEMHGVAVEGRASSLSADEAAALVAVLREDAKRMSDLVAKAASALR
jgi:hypothetical protein